MRRPYLLFLPICLLFIAIGVSLAQDWHIITVESDGNVGEYTSIVLDNSGYPHISYLDRSNYNLKYAKYNGSSWEFDVVDDSEGTGFYTSLELDSNQYPNIAYYQWGDAYDLEYARWNGSSWELEGIDEEYIAGQDCSLKLDSDDHPHISYHRYSYHDLRYAYFDGDEWVIIDVDTQGDTGWYTSIDLDPSENPHISYMGPNSELKHAFFNGSYWELEVVDSSGDISYTSIVVDSEYKIHIAYKMTGSEDLKYAYYDGDDWNTETVDSEGNTGVRPSIDIDSNNYPHISYYDYSNGNLKYAYYDGSEWHKLSVDTDGDVGNHSSIYLDGLGHPHISYYDATNGNLKYAWYGYNLGIELISFSGKYKNDGHIILDWLIENNEDEELVGFNIYRREINNLKHHNVDTSDNTFISRADDMWVKVNSDLIQGTNPYSYTDRGVEKGNLYEYKLEVVWEDKESENLGATKVTTDSGLSSSFGIMSLYPNPCSNVTNCLLNVVDSGEVVIEIYDISGRRVAERTIEVKRPGELPVEITTENLMDGVYIILARSEELASSARILVRH